MKEFYFIWLKLIKTLFFNYLEERNVQYFKKCNISVIYKTYYALQGLLDSFSNDADHAGFKSFSNLRISTQFRNIY